ncbi:MAG: hypothetical protein ACSHX9_02340 [Luteolibacter sp.]
MDKRLHAVPQRWEELAALHGRGLVQLWFHGILRDEDGGAFWVSDVPRNKPRYNENGTRRLMCRPSFRDSLKGLSGKLAVKTKAGVVTLTGEELRDNGRYLTSYEIKKKQW